jgi:hypothetical protein
MGMGNRFFTLAAGLALALAGRAAGAQAQVAVLDSANTKAFFGLHYPACGNGSFFLGAEEYQRYFRGWEFVLQQMGVPFDTILDGDVSEAGLGKYKLLILSNVASLSDSQIRAVKQWVIRGGRLIATFGTGYKDILADPRQDDGLKLQKGGTTGLHELWQDPANKIFGSNPINNGAGTDVRITQYAGPTECLMNQLPGDILPYGAESNILVQRPEQFAGAFGFVVIKNVAVKHPTPAILMSRAAAGLTVYYAFAPEYLVSKEFNLPAAPSCPDGQNWAGRSEKGRLLMRCTIQYLLAH